MKKETFEKAKRLESQINARRVELSRMKAALEDCKNCALMVDLDTFDIDDWTGKRILENKVAILEDELELLEIKFSEL